MLKFIGTGSAFNTELGNNGAYIKDGDKLFLIDCGSSTFERIKRSGLLDGVKHISVLMTHTHPDHVGSLGDLIFYGYYAMGEMMKPSVTVYAPYDLQISSLLDIMGVKNNTYKLERLYGYAEVADFDIDMEVYTVEVNHVKELKCYGYVIEYKNKSAYYSGDCNEIPALALKDLHQWQFDYFYQDTCKADYQGNVHLSLRELDELVDKDVRHMVYCMHLDNGFDVEEAKEMGFNVVSSEL